MTVSTPDRDVRQDVAEVLVRHAAGIDRRDWHRFRSSFTGDCHAGYGQSGIREGGDAIMYYMTRAQPDNVRTLHRITNTEVEREGNGAAARSHVDVIFVAEESRSGVQAARTYCDEPVHTEDGWKIARCRFTPVHLSPIRGGRGKLTISAPPVRREGRSGGVPA